MTDLSCDRLRSLIQIGGGEAKETEACVDQEVLPAIVRSQALAVVGAVVLDDEPRFGVIEVCSSDKMAILIAQIFLDHRRRQTGLDEDPPQAGLHWRLRRLPKVGRT